MNDRVAYEVRSAKLLWILEFWYRQFRSYDVMFVSFRFRLCVLGPDMPRDCYDVLRTGQRNSSVYRIYPAGLEDAGQSVWCDMDTSNGGWTVVSSVQCFVIIVIISLIKLTKCNHTLQ